MSTWLGHMMSIRLTKHYSGCVCGCFWMRLTFESVHWLKKIAFTNVGGPHPISWKEQKDGRRGSSSCLTAWAKIMVFSGLYTQTETLALLGSQVSWLLDWNNTISSPDSQDFRQGQELHHQHSWVPSLLIADFGMSHPLYSHESIIYI